MGPPLILLLLSIGLPAEGALTLLLAAFLVANIQFTHSCVHDTERSVYVKAMVHCLQKLRVMYSIEAHMYHHRYGISNFCLLTGWADLVLNPAFDFLLKHGVVSRANWTSPFVELR
jgi:hypothetical protein